METDCTSGHGQLSKAQSGKTGPAPGRFEFSKGMLDWQWAIILGFETLDLKCCELKLWELTVAGIIVVCVVSCLSGFVFICSDRWKKMHLWLPLLYDSVVAETLDTCDEGETLGLLKKKTGVSPWLHMFGRNMIDANKYVQLAEQNRKPISHLM